MYSYPPDYWPIISLCVCVFNKPIEKTDPCVWDQSDTTKKIFTCVCVWYLLTTTAPSIGLMRCVCGTHSMPQQIIGCVEAVCVAVCGTTCGTSSVAYNTLVSTSLVPKPANNRVVTNKIS